MLVEVIASQSSVVFLRHSVLAALYFEMTNVDLDVDGVYERRPKPLCPHLEITSR